MTRNIRILLVISISIIVWFIPPPDGVQTQAWHMFAIFLGTILSVVIHALPMGASTLIGLVFCVVTHTLEFKKAFGGYSDSIVWLILGAFFIAHGFINSGLGKRIAYRLISLLGRSILGLGYGIAIGEAVVGMVIPSSTARTGGILFPIVNSLIDSVGKPDAKPDQEPINSFLIMTAFHTSIISSAMFLTGMAGNALIVKLATAINVEITWSLWAVAAIAPGILSIIVLPLFFKVYFKPSFGDDALLLKLTKEKYGSLGAMKREEKIMALIFLLLIFLWGCGSILKISAAASVLVGITLMILTNIVKWEELLGLKGSWNTFIWFGALLAMASGLNNLGLSTWFGNFVAGLLSDYSTFVALSGILLIYFYSHYFFASSTAHIGAMLLPLLLVGASLDVSPILVTLLFSFASNLFASLTHYGNGPAPILYGSGFVSIASWWKVGFIVSLINIIIWFGFGMFWWKLIGLY
ncbi:MAG: DASS family sodium-coupled anion symporter [Legionellales bacterium]|nr:DASS family sodium-coupled anion symporter [Legionellales bacterium]